MALKNFFSGTTKSDEIKMHIPFFLYFVSMFIFYKFTYFQLLIQILVILYFGLLLIKRRLRVTKTQIRHLLFYIAWFGSFTLLQFLSQTWAYGVREDSRVLITAIRIFAIGFLMFYYVDCKEKALSVFKALIMAYFVMSIVVLVTTPISGWGSEHVFGKAIAQQRNGLGALSAPFTVFSYYLHKQYGMRYGNYLAIYFAVFTLIGGSRSAALQIVIIFLVHLLLNERSLSKRLKNLVVFASIGTVAVILIMSIPFLYNVVWVRIGDAFSTILGIEIADSSSLGRENLKEVATLMFVQRPLLGYGVDGVVCFLREAGNIIGEQVAAVYSHCNYTEIAACYGIVGLIIWYVPLLRTLVSSFKIRRTSIWASCLFASFLSMIIMDYARIPWSTHMGMYLFFTVVMLIRYEIAEVKTKVSEAQNNTNI